MNNIIPNEHVENSILIIRGQKVIIDSELARLYGVTTGNLNLAVKRNISRFPEDFMFQLTKEEFENLILQSAISSFGGRRHAPYAFTEFGVAMLSSVLRSEKAILVNIEIMRIFGRLRQLLNSHKDLAEKLQELEKKYDKKFRVVFEAIDHLLKMPEEPPKTPMGFNTGS